MRSLREVLSGEATDPRLVETYYACGGYIASGTTVCDAPSIPTAYLDDAVLDGIQKRIDRMLDRGRLSRHIRQRLAAERSVEPELPEIEGHLTEVRRRIDRGVQALLAGAEDLPSVRTALAQLERERIHLKASLTAARSRQTGDGGVEAVVEAMLTALSDVRAILTQGEPEQRKMAVRRFLAGIRVEKTTRQAVLSWYDLPRPPADSVRLVELRGAVLDGVRVETLALPIPRWAQGPR